MSVAEASRQLGVSEQASYRWKKVHGSLQSDQLRELQLLQEENARLKKLVAELSLDKAILQDINSKKMARPAVKRQAVAYVVGHYATSRRRPCRVVYQHRSVQYYRSRKAPKTALRLRMRELAQVRIRYGYRRLHVLLRREGWSMDFVADQPVNGTRFRALTVVDVHTREALDIVVGQRLRGEDVVEAGNRLVAQRGSPVRLFVDNGSEFSGRVFDLWAYHRKATIEFNRLGKPTDNCFVETLSGSLPDECLNVHGFETIDEARAKIEAWRVACNESRPSQARKDLTPAEYTGQARHLVTSEELSNAEI